MSDNSTDADERPIGAAMVAGAALGAGFGAVFLQDVTQGVVGGVVAGVVFALVFPDWTARIADAVGTNLEE